MKKSSILFSVHRGGNDSDEAILHSCSCLKHDFSKPKCHNLHNVQLIFYLSKELHKQASEFFLHTRKMVDGVVPNFKVMTVVAILKSHDSGSHFKPT